MGKFRLNFLIFLKFRKLTLETETIAVQKLARERGGISESTLQQIRRLLNKFKQFFGMDITNILYHPSTTQISEKSQSLAIPSEFLRPITLDIMRDPEIPLLLSFASGRFICCPIRTPKSKNITALLNLSIDESNKRMLNENKVTTAFGNGIPPLVDLLQNGTTGGKRDAVTALFSLSLKHLNKERAIEAGIVPPLLELLEDKNQGIVDEALSIFLLLVTVALGRQAIGHLSFTQTLVDFIKDGAPN
ncbi:hypothetical protein F3Y22_tig00002840pilonHSYRG01318 [Hibiscus syriacus]|uniref:Uncharacterized protein n=1 Tax=Hibiscus syriacus TaxID=106335 RepID=A0A6A3CW51_HIBSY|nr:hypothetical protein F3Y22_tig00002840pilonHSYRG01318 [Hibiscus syriacus]